MVIWLREGQGSVGVSSEIIRRESLGRLCTLDEAHMGLRLERERLLEEARKDAAAILQDAQERADALLADAQRKFEESARRGYAAGHQRGLDDWHAIAARGMVKTQEALARMRERLAQLIVQAVERVVISADRKELYARVGALLDRTIADSTFMTVTVYSGEFERAQEAFKEIAENAGWKLPVEVVGADHLSPGSCLCEWDYGTLDASLPSQLAAVRRAVRRALDLANQSDDELNADQADDTDNAQEGGVDRDAEDNLASIENTGDDSGRYDQQEFDEVEDEEDGWE